MIKHCIIMSSSYTDGTRVALDITEVNLLNIAKAIKYIKEHCDKDVPLSTHFIETASDSWSSVIEYDSFFEDVVCVKSTKEFSEKIKKSRLLTGLDIATYILSKIKCTHLSLEKLVYFAYADYLCEYSKQLFEDKIFAFTHGPVIESVYKTYKGSGAQCINPLGIDNDSYVKTSVRELPARSRILFAEDGAEKLHSVNKTIHKYGKYTAGELVGFTHRPDSPWSHIDSTKRYQIIPDEIIVKYHHIECV